MNARRLILILGPLPIVCGSIGLSRWVRSNPHAPLARNHAVVMPAEAAAPEPLEYAGIGAQDFSVADFDSDALNEACQQTLAELTPLLGEECRAVARPPFVVAGDLSSEDLDRWHRQTLGPAARAMANCYFRNVPPDRPVTVLLFSGEQSYNRFAKQLFGDERISVYGYYKPNQRTLVMNIGTGGGTLVHELTHALMDFDFPQAPDWFNEGLASLHEQCQIRPDESGIDGLVNWRLAGLQQAIADGQLRPLRELISANDFRGERQGVNYAQARYFCLYMQERGILTQFFHRFRGNHETDRFGEAAVAATLPNMGWEKLEEDFRRWAARLQQ